MTREEIKNKVVEIIANKISLSKGEIKESSNFKSDIGTDSLDDIELLMEFECVFGIRILDEEMLTVRTVGEAIDGICEKLGVSICKKEQPEADLEKELIQWHKRHFKKSGTYEEHSGFYLENSSQLDLARHFYELGMNARKED